MKYRGYTVRHDVLNAVWVCEFGIYDWPEADTLEELKVEVDWAIKEEYDFHFVVPCDTPSL